MKIFFLYCLSTEGSLRRPHYNCVFLIDIKRLFILNSKYKGKQKNGTNKQLKLNIQKVRFNLILFN